MAQRPKPQHGPPLWNLASESEVLQGFLETGTCEGCDQATGQNQSRMGYVVMASKRSKRRELNESNRLKNLINAISDLKKIQAKLRARIKKLNEPAVALFGAYTKETDQEQFVPLPAEGVGMVRADGGVLHEDGYIRYPNKPTLLGYD